MNSFNSLLQGFSLGLAFAAPIGSQNVYVIRSAATNPLILSMRVAVVVGLADVILGQACLFGFGSLLTMTSWLAASVTAIGAVFLLYIGSTLLARAPTQISKQDHKPSIPSMTWWKIVTAAIALTWFNPQALVDGALILGGFRAQLNADELPMFAVGMGCASMAWFSTVTIGIGCFRAKFTDRTMLWINRVCGALLCVLGIKLGLNLLHMLMR